MPADSSPLAVSLAGIPLRNPVILAAGACGTLDEMHDALDLSRVGALVTKSITPAPRAGNAVWRIIDAGPAGMLNAIGLANPGLEAFLEHVAPRASRVPCPVFASIAGFSIDDYVQVAAHLDEWSAAHDLAFPALELNVSCPNVKTGTEFGSSPLLIRELLAAVRPVVRHTRLIVKLSPATHELPLVAHAAALAGADILTIGNTYPAMAIDVHSRRPRLANGTGGLSGPGIHPIAVKLVRDVALKLRNAPRPPRALGAGAPVLAADHPGEPAPVPIIGLGGVLRWEHAAEFILAGATAVGMGTALFVDPRSPLSVNKGLEHWVRTQRESNIASLIGAIEG